MHHLALEALAILQLGHHGAAIPETAMTSMTAYSTSTSIVIPFRDKINPRSMVICLNLIPQTNLYWLVVYLPL